MNKINQISKGVSQQRVEDFKKKTETPERELVLKKIVYIVFFVSLAILLGTWKLLG